MLHVGLLAVDRTAADSVAFAIGAGDLALPIATSQMRCFPTTDSSNRSRIV